MRARDIMTPDPITVAPETSVREAARLLTAHGISSMPVVDDGRIVGIVSELDVIHDRLPHDPRARVRPADDGPDPPMTVREIMEPTVICLPDNTDVADIAATLRQHRLRAVPIVAASGLVGMVSRRDIVRSLLRDDAAIVAEARERLAAYDPTVDWQLTAHDGVLTVHAPASADARAEQRMETLVRTVPGIVRVHVRSSHFAR